MDSAKPHARCARLGWTQRTIRMIGRAAYQVLQTNLRRFRDLIASCGWSFRATIIKRGCAHFGRSIRGCSPEIECRSMPLSACPAD